MQEWCWRSWFQERQNFGVVLGRAAAVWAFTRKTIRYWFSGKENKRVSIHSFVRRTAVCLRNFQWFSLSRTFAYCFYGLHKFNRCNRLRRRAHRARQKGWCSRAELIRRWRAEFWKVLTWWRFDEKLERRTSSRPRVRFQRPFGNRSQARRVDFRNGNTGKCRKSRRANLCGNLRYGSTCDAYTPRSTGGKRVQNRAGRWRSL